jgi:hypothetical protein
MKKIIFLLVLLPLLSCKKDPAVVPDYMDPERFPVEIQPILKTFLAEGNKRGVYCDINKLRKIVLVNYQLNDNGKTVEGYYDHYSNTITIDTSGFQWKNNKEATLFHELGHGILKRGHRNGYWIYSQAPYSIMNGDGHLPLYNNPAFLFQRPYYMDELFNQNTPFPSWAN